MLNFIQTLLKVVYISQDTNLYIKSDGKCDNFS